MVLHWCRRDNGECSRAYLPGEGRGTYHSTHGKAPALIDLMQRLAFPRHRALEGDALPCGVVAQARDEYGSPCMQDVSDSPWKRYLSIGSQPLGSGPRLQP